jgi:peptidoglycan/xylan/chitin deacetylase (PgdA/CDA1 family)
MRGAGRPISSANDMIRQQVPIFMYHEVVEANGFDTIAGRIQTDYVVDTATFESHLRRLRELDCSSIGLDALIGWLRDGMPIPERSVVITFDDGFAGNATLATPLLEKYGFMATFFIATNRIGDTAMVSWDQLREMAARGMAIESHTASHPLLSTLSAEETRRELAGSREVLELNLGRPVNYISLPNGDSNPWYASLACQSGYRGGCGSEFGVNDREVDPYFLRRIAIKRHTTARDIGDYVLRDSLSYNWAMSKARLKRMVPQIIGKQRYDRLYNTFFGVAEQRKGRAG